MVRGDRNAASSGVNKSEKFGDGRDSSSDEDSDHIGPNEARSNVGRNNDDDDDEEFGDFAMAEVSAKDDIGGREKVEGSGNSENKGSQSDAAGSSSGNGATSGGLYLDSDPDTVLFKPLAVHPPSSNNTTESSSGGSGGTTVSGLWPFERLRFLTNTDAEKDEQESGNGNTNANGSSVNGYTDADAKGKDASSADYGDGMEVLSEDGHKVSCVTEAARRTSLEGPDEDEVVV
ncbi:hypothetical protein CMQ_4903 [Grosmannia clavigera kw1407]|uniref:Uncharacterized protein n=1 Tax=Grosmannia clavigera (strain kw1407 / UAMH 11150) TaxID=655863 RepID=F0XV59_GROCL|nr:uncharacterized protein CMQ_4903 [Grosmannia clavigera kw1407]EFW99051.1 hypothetical protein CMQ_4903 [Grosmannia clavigera kw1407]